VQITFIAFAGLITLALTFQFHGTTTVDTGAAASSRRQLLCSISGATPNWTSHTIFFTDLHRTVNATRQLWLHASLPWGRLGEGLDRHNNTSARSMSEAQKENLSCKLPAPGYMYFGVALFGSTKLYLFYFIRTAHCKSFVPS